MAEMGAEDLIPRIITTGEISEVIKYDSGMQYLIGNPCHVKLPSQEDDLGGIAGLEDIKSIQSIEYYRMLRSQGDRFNIIPSGHKKTLQIFTQF